MTRPKPSPAILALRTAYECPDCNVEKKLRHDGLMWHMDVYHDDTCPALAEIERRR